MLILKGDLELEVKIDNFSEDLSQLFVEFQRLNLLNKYSDPQYFNVAKAERLIKYLKCVELFEEIGYDKVSLYENISDCYTGLG